MIVVPGCPSEDGLTWWVFSSTGNDPQLRLAGEASGTAAITVRPIPGAPPPRKAFLVATTSLLPDREYELSAGGDGSPASARSRTLPGSTSGKPFTFAIGSCFSIACDQGVAKDYPPYRHRSATDPIRFRILCGDQLYMDLSPEQSILGAAPIVAKAPDPWQKYIDQWLHERFLPLLGSSPNLFMADDHEYWNDYPHSNAWLFWDENHPGGPRGTDMDKAFEVFQAALNLPARLLATPASNLATLLANQARTFELDLGVVSLFVLDTRTARTRYDDANPHFTRPSWLAAARQWLSSLDRPGLLLLSQPLIENRAGWATRLTHTMGDVNLPDYDEDYASLWESLTACPRRVLILSGDIHWSRLCHITPSSKPIQELAELISSPLSLLSMQPTKLDSKTGGSISWQGGGLANWSCGFQTNARQTYATVTVMPKGPRGSPVTLEISWWCLSSNPNTGATLIESQSLEMT